MKVNKIDEVWNSVNLLLKWIFSLLSSKNFATKAMWRNDFSSLLMRPSWGGYACPHSEFQNLSLHKLYWGGISHVPVCIFLLLLLFGCSFNPPSCCLLPYILICLTLSFQSHVVCWNFTLTGLHQCGHYGHFFLVYM